VSNLSRAISRFFSWIFVKPQCADLRKLLTYTRYKNQDHLPRNRPYAGGHELSCPPRTSPPGANVKGLIALITALLSVAAAVAASAWISAIVAGVIGALFLLVAGLAMTGTFGSARVRRDAQTVLAILLGRNHAGGTGAKQDSGCLTGRSYSHQDDDPSDLCTSSRPSDLCASSRPLCNCMLHQDQHI
jgi:hypothetical protein